MKNSRSIAVSSTARVRRAAAVIAALMLCLAVLPAFAESAPNTGSMLSISLSDSGITGDFPGVSIAGSVLTITLPGEYLLTGSLSDGQIVVDCEQDGKVRLFLNGISVHCETAPALYIKSCSPRLSIELLEGTVNELSDGAAYAEKDSNVDAVIFSKSDLTITGAGSLNVKGAYRDGIVSKDDLRIKGGKITVEAVHNGICGKDCVEIFEGDVTVKAGNDGIKTTNTDPDWGFIAIEGGTVNITCGDEPLKVVNRLTITGGTVNAAVIVPGQASDD